ncbi:MAG: DUF3078 domain-containing protein [Parabacteroides sp.]
MMKRIGFFLLFVTCVWGRVTAQSNSILTPPIMQQSLAEEPQDTVPVLEVLPEDLDKIPDLRVQLERSNASYSVPKALNEHLQELFSDDQFKLSEEALYWVNWHRDESTVIPSYMSFKDTMIVNRLFLPLLFKGERLPHNLTFYNLDTLYHATAYDHLYKPDPLFEDLTRIDTVQQMALRYVEEHEPTAFRYTYHDLPGETIKLEEIQKNIQEEDVKLKVQNDANFEEVETPVKFIPERRYWTSSFESTVQFAQNYISSNWYKGGTSTLNLTNRQYFVYNYEKDKVQVKNELEWKTNVYTAPKDTLRNYKIGDDVLRLHSNFGFKAYSKWYYTFDFTFQTQIFSNFAENTNNKLASFMSPFSINAGLGMKYDLSKTFSGKKHKKVTLSANIAPVSYTYMYSTSDDIDWGRHGFEKNASGEYKHTYSKFGSTVNATLNFQFNRNVSWYSRFYYFTSYERILGEFENRLTMAISRFFSTTISLNLRYDDAAQKSDDWNGFLQVNELLSFGFNYKW